MPMPERRAGEAHDKFLERCMGDAVMIREFPDATQRRAVCERRAKAEAGGEVVFACAPDWADASAGPDGKPAGLPRFTMTAYTGGPMRLAGWRWPVIVELSGLAIPSQNRPIRLGHDAAQGVGHTDGIRVEGNQLVATGVVSRDTPAAREVVASSRNGFPWQASIGAVVEEAEFVREGQRAVVNGREWPGPLNVVRKAVLGEISFVDLGADERTSARVAAYAKEDDMEQDTENQAHPQGAAADARKQGADSSQPDVAADIRAEAAAETERIAAVRRICDGKHAEIEAKAIRERWDATRCELEVLRADRPAAPAVATGSDGAPTALLLEAACALTEKLNRPEEHYPAELLERAGRRFRGGIGLQELFLEAAWANGYTGRSFRESREAMRYAFGREVRAGFSTVDLGGILSNVANKFLLEGFFSVERTWRNVCAVRNVPDFKTVTSYRLVGRDQYEQVAPGGELKHGTLGEESFTNKADTYGLMLTIDRRDVINDDLGASTLVPRKLGRGSGLKLNDVFWNAFLNNASFFTLANKNYLVGVDTALGIDGLSKAETAFMEQVDSDGKPIGVMPAIVLVPPALSAMATQLYKSLELRDRGASVKYPVSNPHQGKFRTEVSRYLSNPQYEGHSQKAWYLLADPNDLPVIEVAFLNGQESPVIETAEADFNVLGVQMRGYHDFGVALQDPRGGIKARGEA